MAMSRFTEQHTGQTHLRASIEGIALTGLKVYP
jgi:hypothetical protein